MDKPWYKSQYHTPREMNRRNYMDETHMSRKRNQIQNKRQIGVILFIHRTGMSGEWLSLGVTEGMMTGKGREGASGVPRCSVS